MRNRLKILLSLGLSLTPFSAFAGKDIEFAVEKFTLKNGMTVLVHEDHDLPLISYQQWFRVGSSHERPGRTGLAHFFEHLMFKGTQKYPEGELDRQIQKSGGTFNAYTTEDLTAYYINIPSDKFEMVAEIEADRMRNLVFDEARIQSEREVVKEERRMRVENSPMGILFEALRTTVYKTSPYRWPVIGYMRDLNSAKLKDFKSFYDSYYVPNNAVVVVAGDVKTSRVKKVLEKYYGDIPAGKIPEFKPVPEAEQKSPRETVVKKKLESSTVAVVYRAVDEKSPDIYALDYLASILGSGDSSRLYQRLVYKNQLATSVGAGSNANTLSGTFNIIAGLRPGVATGRVEALIADEIQRIQKDPVSDEEMNKIRNMLVLQYVRGLETVSSKASALANYEVRYGDYKRLFQDYIEYQKVTKEDVQAAAKKYLVSSRRSIIRLVAE